MSADYTGDRTATQAPSGAPGSDVSPVGRLPSDGDAANVASVWQDFKVLLDFVDWLTHHGVWTDIARTVTAGITFQETQQFDAPGDTSPTRKTTVIPTAYKLIDQWDSGTYKVRFYISATFKYVVTYNAVYTANVGAEWARDVAGDATMVITTDSGSGWYQYLAAGASPWATAGWGSALAAVGPSGVSAPVIEATTGNVEATLGDVKALDGNVQAIGTPVGSAGPGIVKGNRIYAEGTAMTSGQIVLGAGWGGSPMVSNIEGDDTHMRFRVTAVLGAGALANPATITVTWKDGTFTNTPYCIAALRDTNDSVGTAKSVTWGESATAVIVSYNAVPVDTKTYDFEIITIGRT